MDTVVLRWPEDASRLDRLRVTNTARLLLVPSGTALPDVEGCLEDFVRLPADAADISARVAALAFRARGHQTTAAVDDSGLLWHREHWVSLPPLERRLAESLIERFGRVVAHGDLIAAAWPNGGGHGGLLRVEILRLRRRSAAVGLQIRTVRSRGYLMQLSSQGSDPDP
ncbi:MAG: winged helix-turn-helix domain-containing protein [Acidimicrobiia bacterium]